MPYYYEEELTQGCKRQAHSEKETEREKVCVLKNEEKSSASVCEYIFANTPWSNIWYLPLWCKYVFKIVYLLVYRFCALLSFAPFKCFYLNTHTLARSLSALKAAAFSFTLSLLSVHGEFIDVKTLKAHQLYDIFIIFPSFPFKLIVFSVFSAYFDCHQ